MKEISQKELEEEYDLIYSEKLEKMYSMEESNEFVYVYMEYIGSIIKYDNYEARKKMSTCIDIISNAEVCEKDKKKIINKVINKMLENRKKMDIKIKKYIEKKYEYKDKFDRGEISKDEYDKHIENISKKEHKVFLEFMQDNELKNEFDKLGKKQNIKRILKIIVCVLLGVFILKNAKKIKEVAKDITLVLSKETIKTIREKNKVKALETTKDIALECINKAKPLENGITLNI